MRVPVKWLYEHVSGLEDISMKELEARLIMSGSNTEGVHHYEEANSKVVVGRIESINPHPDADKLTVLKVNVGEDLQIVTGATNISVGDYIPVALVGAKLANGLKIKKGKLRGEVSNGMLCSLEEIGYGQNVIPKAYADGIYIFDQPYELGKSIFEVTDLGDHVIEFEITPNRPDCLSIEGMAREAKATFALDRKVIEPLSITSDEEVKKYVEVEVEDSKLTPRYMALVIKDVTITASPQWMQTRLMQAGIRPINVIVDITNYVLLETGNPIHAFDLDLVDEQKIIVRRAKEGEKLTTLDSIERTLTEEDIVIASPKRVIGLAGIMGGENTEIHEGTKNIIIEIANFNKTAIRLSSRRLGLRSEASGRFEKGIDPNTVAKAAGLLVKLCQELGVGSLVEGGIDLYPEVKNPINISLRPDFVNKKLGITLTPQDMMTILEKLECQVEKSGQELVVTPPTARLDLVKEIDLVEEIARIYGYDKLPITLPKDSMWGGLTPRQGLEKKLRNHLLGAGLSEILTYSFVSPRVNEKIRWHNDQMIILQNPLGEEYSAMRTTLLPNMMEILSRNYKYGNEEVKVYEFGNTFIPVEGEQLPKEVRKFTLGAYGQMDFFTMKGIIEEIFERIGLPSLSFKKASGYDTFHPGRVAKVYLGQEELGIFGELHPITAENYGMKGQRIYAGEFIFDGLLEKIDGQTTFSPLPKYPPMERDLALLVKEEVTNGQIMDLILEHGGSLLESAKLFDVYRGKQIEEGYKSMAYNMVFRNPEKTLTEDEVQKPYEKILNAIVEKTGAIRR